MLGNAQMPGQMEQMIDFDALVTNGVISQETGDNIKTYMDEHKPTEGEGTPSEEQMPTIQNDGQRLSLLDELLYAEVITAQEYEQISAAQKENQTADSQQQGGQMPGNDQQGGQMPGGQGPMEQMIDFDALVTNGVISQETGDNIKTYMDEHKPTEGDGDPSEEQMPTIRNDGQRLSLLDELLYAEVITAQEYEQISAAQKENQTTDGQTPPAMPGQDGQQMPGMPGMPGDSSNVEYTAATTVTESAEGTSYASSNDNENAVLVSGNEVTLTNANVDKTGSSSGESADFNGTNAAVLATSGATLTIADTSVTTNGTHANGVFSYGSGTTVNVSNTTITTTGNNSGGLMTTGGATTNASNLTVSTSGNSSAAIRSDRGGGTVNVTEGTYDTTGVGSPAIYSTADITVSDATLKASNSEAVVIEGGNSVTLENVSITGSNATLNGQSTQKTNVLIYQSMSGDASEGSSTFTMTGGTMTAETGSMFHVTNVTTTINLENVEFNYSADSNVFLDASADSWGSSGRNGGNVTLNLKNQSIVGAITSDSVSSVIVNLDSDSTWTLTGDSYVTAFNGDLSNVNLNGYTLYVNGAAVA